MECFVGYVHGRSVAPIRCCDGKLRLHFISKQARDCQRILDFGFWILDWKREKRASQFWIFGAFDKLGTSFGFWITAVQDNLKMAFWT
jgi:hypothetical protein